MTPTKAFWIAATDASDAVGEDADSPAAAGAGESSWVVVLPELVHAVSPRATTPTSAGHQRAYQHDIGPIVVSRNCGVTHATFVAVG